MVAFTISIAILLLWLTCAFLALSESLNISTAKRWFSRNDPVIYIASIALIASIAVFIQAYYYESPIAQEAVRGVFSNWLTELIFFSFTILIIDQLTRRRLAKDEKRRIIRQMSSNSNDFALEGVRLATENGWLTDGSLRRADISSGRLENAMLVDADLEGANLQAAYLESAILTGLTQNR